MDLRRGGRLGHEQIHSLLPALDLSGSIYFGSGNGYCYSIADNGNASLNWKVLTGDRVDASPVLGTGNEVFFVSATDTSAPLTRLPESLIGRHWSETFSTARRQSIPTEEFAISYIGGGENHLFAYEANGSKAWDTNGTNPPFTIGGVVDSSLALDSSGKLYLAPLTTSSMP